MLRNELRKAKRKYLGEGVGLEKIQKLTSRGRRLFGTQEYQDFILYFSVFSSLLFVITVDGKRYNFPSHLF